VVRFNFGAEPERYTRIGEAMGIDMRGMAEQERGKRLIGELAALRHRIGIVDSLAARGIRAADIPDLTGHAIGDVCLVTNPRRAGSGDINAIYGDAL
jgi:alcohol dehydrogenase class IV